MKITALRGIPVESNLIVKVETDEGIYGIGEAGMAPQIAATCRVLEYYSEWLVGRDPLDIEGIWQELFRWTRRKEGIVLISAISGIDMALHDIKGKVLGGPVWQIIGGRARERVALYAHIRGTTPEEAREGAIAAVEKGFTVVRLGFDDPRMGVPGDGFDAGRAIRHSARVTEAVREAVGEEVEITIDVHQRLTPTRAVEFGEAVKDARPLFVEDPVRPEDPCAYRRLKGRMPVPTATGENLYSKWQFRPLIEEELTDYLRTDLALVGGITEARKVAVLGETHFMDVVPHCARGPLLELVTLHFSTAVSNVLVQEHIGGPEWWNDVLPGLPDFSGGYALPPKAPGLGVEFDEAAAAKHPFVQRQMPRWRKPDGSVQDW